MGPECACGCGESLPEGSVRQYKRGHKRNSIQAENAMLAGETDVFPGADTIGEETPRENPFFKIARDNPEARDPSPSPRKRTRKGSIKITDAIRGDVEGKVALLLLTSANALQLADPVCGGVLLQQAPDIAEKLTPILCQSAAVVEWFQRGTSLIMYVELVMALGPVLATVWQHHLSSNSETVPEVPFTEDWYGVR